MSNSDSTIKVLDKGFVRLVDHMGDDSAIVPITIEAFEDYRLNSMSLSKLEVNALKNLLSTLNIDTNLDELKTKFSANISNKRELGDFMGKLKLLLGS